MNFIFWARNLYCNVRFRKFILVGMLNTAVGYSIFLLALSIGLHYSLAIAVSTIMGALFNFKSTGVLVFQSSDKSRIFRFILVYFVLYALNTAGVAMLSEFGLQAWLAGLLLTPPLALFSYYLNSHFVF